MEAMGDMGGALTVAWFILILLIPIVLIFWLIIPFILIRKLNNIEEAVRTFHTDLAQFLNDYATKTMPR